MDATVTRMTEIELRNALRAHLAEAVASCAGRVVEELGVERGAARIDVALITDRLVGFEIKSDFDTFKRLTNQIHAFNRVFDEFTLVTGAAWHEDALRLLPSWWGVMVANTTTDGSIMLRQVRPATKNPVQDAAAVAMLLWKPEAVDVLSEHIGRAVPARWGSAKLHAILAEELSLDTLQRIVAIKLTTRVTWRSPEPSERDDDSSHLAATSTDFLT